MSYEDERGSLQRRGSQIGCLRLGGLGQRPLLNTAGKIQWRSRLGGRDEHIVGTDDGGSQGMDDMHDKHGRSSEIAGSLYAGSEKTDLTSWKDRSGGKSD